MGPRRIAALLVAMLLSAAAPAHAAPPPPPPLVTNGDFESPAVAGAPESTVPSGWSTDWSAPYLTGAQTWPAASGSQSVEFATFSGSPSIYQDVPAVDGTRYDLSFAYSGDPGRDTTNWDCNDAHAVKRLLVTWRGAGLGWYEFDTTGRSTADMGWKTAHVLVDAGGATSRLSFAGGGSACGPVLDHVVLGTPTSDETSVRISDPGLIYIGQDASVTATVLGATPATVPTGAVQFRIDGANVGDPVPLVNGVAQATIPSPHALSNSWITAVYQPDSAAFSSSSATQGYSVWKGKTSTTLTSTPFEPYGGQPFDVTASVSAEAPALGTPPGAVELTDTYYNPLTDPFPLDAGGSATLPFDGLDPGVYDLYVTYASNDDWDQSTGYLQLIVDKVPTALGLSGDTAVAPGATYTIRAGVTAGVESPYKPTGTIQFSLGGSKLGDPVPLGSDGSVALTQTAPNVATTLDLTANYSGDDYFNALGSSWRVRVRVPAVRTSPTTTPPPASATPAPAPLLPGPGCKLAPAKVSLRRALARGLLVAVSCGTASAVKLSATVSKKQARRLGLTRRPTGNVTIATGAHVLSTARSFRLRLTFSKRYAARLARLKRLPLTLAAFARTGQNTPQSLSQTLTLTR